VLRTPQVHVACVATNASAIFARSRGPLLRADAATRGVNWEAYDIAAWKLTDVGITDARAPIPFEELRKCAGIGRSSVNERADQLLAGDWPVPIGVQRLGERIDPLAHRHRHVNTEIPLSLLDETPVEVKTQVPSHVRVST
jgi:hypothetical protein